MTELKSAHALDVAHSIIDLLDSKKGQNIILLDMVAASSFTDYFVICTGGSARTLKALSDEVRTQLKKDYSSGLSHIEGDADSGWILHDYGDVILHLFSENLRQYYGLEDLWSESTVLLHLQ
jgi:ribosome-associated protein